MISFRGSRADIRRIATQLQAMASGATPDQMNIARGVMLAVGFAALSDIKKAYITKARGGTDEMGIRWPRLSREYLAYQRRFGGGEQSRLKKAAGLGAGNKFAPGNKKGLLNKAQLEAWRAVYARNLARLSVSMSLPDAKALAAQRAWAYVKKRMNAKTMLEVFGDRQVEILRDTGILFNSLSPGVLSGSGPAAAYQKPTLPGGQEQVFQVEPGAVIVGTTVRYANAHQNGIRVPRRQFLPENAQQIPQIWYDRWAKVAAQAFAVGIELMYRRAG